MPNNSYDRVYFSADVSKYKEINEIKNTLCRKQIYPDVVINNAAGNFACPFNKLSENGWKRIYRYCFKWLVQYLSYNGKAFD